MQKIFGHSDQCILEEVFVAPRRAQGPGARFRHCPKVDRSRLKAFRVNEK